MARCGCASKCSCLVIAGNHVTVTGNGSLANPYVITADALNVQDENGLLSNDVTQMDFQGAGVTAALVSGEVVITIPGYTDEQARDALGTALVAGSGINIVVNDAGDTITISSYAGAGTSAFSLKTTSYTLQAVDEVVFFDGASLTATLPTPVGAGGKRYTVKNLNASTLTVATVAGLLDGLATKSLAQYDAISVISDNTNWGVV